MKKELGITVLLVVLCIIVAVLNPRFLGASNLTNMARLIGMYGIFSIGVGLVIITAGIDLSLGSVFALQGVILAIMLREWNLAWPLAVLASRHRRHAAGSHPRLVYRVCPDAAIYRDPLWPALLSRSGAVYR